MTDRNFDEELKQLNLGNTTGWTPAKKIPSTMLHTPNGFDASVWVNNKSNKVVIVMYGSKQFNDWVNNDTNIAVDKLPPQFYSAQRLYKQVQHSYSGYDTSATGLSLGAVLTEMLVAANPGLKGLGFSTVGIDMNKLIREYPKTFKPGLNNNMKSYINETDWFANAKRDQIYGNVWILPGPKGLSDYFPGSNYNPLNVLLNTSPTGTVFKELDHHLDRSHIMDSYRNVDLSKAKRYVNNAVPVKGGGGNKSHTGLSPDELRAQFNAPYKVGMNSDEFRDKFGANNYKKVNNTPGIRIGNLGTFLENRPIDTTGEMIYNKGKTSNSGNAANSMYSPTPMEILLPQPAPTPTYSPPPPEPKKQGFWGKLFNVILNVVTSIFGGSTGPSYATSTSATYSSSSSQRVETNVSAQIVPNTSNNNY